MTGLRGWASCLLISIFCVGGLATAPARAAGLPVQFWLTGGGRAIPRSFLGLSAEYTQLSAYEREGAVFGNVLSLLRPRDGSPLLLRVGGKSADHTLWEPRWGTRRPHLPRDLYVAGRAWMGRLATLVRAFDLRLMLDLNLAVHSPAMSVRLARAAQAALPPGRLAGVEIGNEPDLYWRQPNLVAENALAGGRDRLGEWTASYTPQDYRRDYLSYATPLHAALPGVPLGGPETISAPPPWVDATEDLGPLTPRMVTIHRYPESSCFPIDSPFYPSIPHLLGENASAGLARTVAGAIVTADAHRQQLRLTEVNSVSCGGDAGVADTFATALWSVDALLELVQAGVDGVNWHIRPNAINAPFHPTATGVAVAPELYGLALFAQLTGPGARLLNGTLEQFTGLQVTVWAARSDRGMQVVLINKGPLAADVSLDLGETVTGELRRLVAPAVSAASGVTFGGRRIGHDGRWHGAAREQSIHARGAEYQLSLPGTSAALLTIPR